MDEDDIEKLDAPFSLDVDLADGAPVLVLALNLEDKVDADFLKNLDAWGDFKDFF